MHRSSSILWQPGFNFISLLGIVVAGEISFEPGLADEPPVPHTAAGCIRGRRRHLMMSNDDANDGDDDDDDGDDDAQ